MLDRETLRALVPESYCLERVEWSQGENPTLPLSEVRGKGHSLRARGRAFFADSQQPIVRRVRELTLFECREVVHIPRRPVWCKRCSWPPLEKLVWLGCPPGDVVIRQGLRETTAGPVERTSGGRVLRPRLAHGKSIDQLRLRARVAEPAWSTIRYWPWAESLSAKQATHYWSLRRL